MKYRCIPDKVLRKTLCGVSWPSGLVHRTQVLVLSENQNVGSIPGSGTCVLQQDT